MSTDTTTPETLACGCDPSCCPDGEAEDGCCDETCCTAPVETPTPACC